MSTNSDTTALSHVTPQIGSGGVNLRSVPNTDPSTQVGTLREGAQLELDKSGSDWHACRVYLSSQFAGSDGTTIASNPGEGTINIRLSPNVDPSTDVGDLAAQQRLEYIGISGDWFIGRVYVAAQYTIIVTPGPQPTGPDVPSGSPLTLAELQALSLTPGKLLKAPANATQAALTAARIWNKYGGLLDPLANKIGIDPGCAVAVVAVESGGSGLGPDGRMIIRFENHLFWSSWGQANAEAYNAHFVFDQTTSWKGHQYRVDANSPWQDVHANQSSEWAAFGLAQTLNDHAAKMSISMGLVQILGSNAGTIGYASTEAMFEAFSVDERFQLLGFFNFVKNSATRLTALQQQDFVTFAKSYNGPGQPDYYGGLIKDVFDGFHALVPA